MRKIEAFRDALSANDDVVIAGADLFVDLAELPFGGGVGIEAGDAGAREEALKLGFEVFCAEALVANAGIVAIGTTSWYGLVMATAVATQREGVGVQSHW